MAELAEVIKKLPKYIIRDRSILGSYKNLLINDTIELIKLGGENESNKSITGCIKI